GYTGDAQTFVCESDGVLQGTSPTCYNTGEISRFASFSMFGVSLALSAWLYQCCCMKKKARLTFDLNQLPESLQGRWLEQDGTTSWKVFVQEEKRKKVDEAAAELGSMILGSDGTATAPNQQEMGKGSKGKGKGKGLGKGDLKGGGKGKDARDSKNGKDGKGKGNGGEKERVSGARTAVAITDGSRRASVASVGENAPARGIGNAPASGRRMSTKPSEGQLQSGAGAATVMLEDLVADMMVELEADIGTKSRREHRLAMKKVTVDGMCSPCEDPDLCLTYMFCPLCRIADSCHTIGQPNWLTYWKVFWAYVICPCCWPCFNFYGRYRIRKAFQLKLEPHRDFAAHCLCSCCCGPCAHLQEARLIEAPVLFFKSKHKIVDFEISKMTVADLKAAHGIRN
ncbi:unnamed protein product, partial [Polarella glacialis]